MKHVCKREIRQNTSKLFNQDNEPAIVTNHGNPQYFVGKIDTVNNLETTINSLKAFRSSLADNIGGAGGSLAEANGSFPSVNYSASSMSMPQETKDALISEITQKPFTEGGVIKYKKHTHK